MKEWLVILYKIYDGSFCVGRHIKGKDSDEAMINFVSSVSELWDLYDENVKDCAVSEREYFFGRV